MNTDDALRLGCLRIRRTPGIREPFVLDGLSSRVNLIHGPNASGKTSTARAIEAVLWPEAVGHARLGVSAEYELLGCRYVVEIDASHVGVTQDGADGRPPTLPAPELRHRYHLALHELLVASDKGDRFADEIARQSAGGYDLPGAAKALDFAAKPSTAGAESAALRAARHALKKAQEEQAALHAEAQQLASLEARCVEAQRANGRAQLIERALKHAHARASLDAARERLASFPEALQGLHGDEHDRLIALETEARGAEEEAAAARSQLQSAERAAVAALPTDAPSDELVPALRAMVAEASDTERAIAEGERQLDGASAQLEQERRAIGAIVTDAQLAELDAEAFGDLAVHAREVEQTSAAIAAADAEVRQAGDQAALPDLEALRRGLHILAEWLGEAGTLSSAGKSPRSSPRLVWLLVGIAALGWLALALGGTPLAVIAALVAVMVAGMLGHVLTRSGDAEPDMRATRTQDYRRLGLPEPSAWTPEAVAAHVDALATRLADGRTTERRESWRADAVRRRQELEHDRGVLADRHAALVARLGIAPDVDARQLSWIVERAGAWRNARRARAGVDARIARAREQLVSTLDAIGERLAPFGHPAPSGASEAAGLVAALEDRIRAHAAAVAAQEGARARLATAEVRREHIAAQIRALLVGAGAADAAALELLCAQHAAFADARQSHVLAEHECRSARADLERDALFDDSLVDRAPADLQEELARAQALVDEYGALVQRATELRTRVDAAKQQGDVERALAAVAAAEEALRAIWSRDLRAMVGEALVRHVQRATRDQHRPEVFHRARELFARVTRGRYTLEFEDGDGAAPTFRAVDARTGVTHALNELSSATRVQLLLAVRVAFVETQEHGVRLPLVLDETLGTSDDHRAHAIIDAVIALAEGGRQIFYFTAQRDEVAKWEAALAARAVHHAVIDLSARRGLEPLPADELPVAPYPRESILGLPEPDSHDHGSYGRVLAVPPVVPGAGSAASTHLWYVIDDVRALHHLLSFGVCTWGELETLVHHGGVQVLTDHPRAYARARALAHVLDVLHERAAVGRGRTVDREVLEDCAAVSSQKIDEVMEIVARVGGRANLLLEALDRGDVRGFGAKKVAGFREYLDQQGFLDDRAPLAAEEIRTAMLGAAMNDIRGGVLEPEDVDHLLRRIRRGSPGDGASGPIAPTAPTVELPPASPEALPA